MYIVITNEGPIFHEDGLEDVCFITWQNGTWVNGIFLKPHKQYRLPLSICYDCIIRKPYVLKLKENQTVSMHMSPDGSDGDPRNTICYRIIQNENKFSFHF